MNSYGAVLECHGVGHLKVKLTKRGTTANARLLETRHVKNVTNEKRKCYKNSTLHKVVWKSFGNIRVSHC